MNKLIILWSFFLFQSCGIYHKKKEIKVIIPTYTYQVMDSSMFKSLYGPNARLGMCTCVSEYAPNCRFDSIVIYTVKNGVFKYDTIPRPGVKK